MGVYEDHEFLKKRHSKFRRKLLFARGAIQLYKEACEEYRKAFLPECERMTSFSYTQKAFDKFKRAEELRGKI